MREVTVVVPAAAETERVKFTAYLVSTATRYVSDMTLIDGRNTIDLKSIMGMMTIVVSAGKTFTIKIDGKDEDIAAEAIENYFIEK